MMMQATNPPNISIDIDEVNSTVQQMMALPSSTRGDEGIIEGNLNILIDMSFM
jgi:hypothetical protein